MTVFLAMALRPFLLFLLLACICLPARFAVKRWVPAGKIKSWLLTDIKQLKHLG